MNVKAWGGFDEWSREIREPLIWLGVADPCATRERVIVNDPERDSALAVLSLWYESFGERAMPLAELAQHASQELKDCLLAVSADRDNLLIIDTRRLGTWCSKVEDRVYGEFRLSRDGTAQRADAVREHKPTLLASLQLVRNVTPDSRNPLLGPDVRAKIEAVEAEARVKGWPAELLWNAGFWDCPRGLAAVLEPSDEIGDVTTDYIEIWKLRRDRQRFMRRVS